MDLAKSFKTQAKSNRNCQVFQKIIFGSQAYSFTFISSIYSVIASRSENGLYEFEIIRNEILIKILYVTITIFVVC